MEFKDILKEHLKENNLSQEDFAKAVDTSQGTVSKWLSGTQEPSYRHLKNMCEKYEIDANYLLGIKEF